MHLFVRLNSLRLVTSKTTIAFHFMLVLDSKHSFIGSTPERLYSRHGTELDTEALAGTIGRGENALPKIWS